MDVITRWDPVKEMEDLQNRLSNFFGRRPARLGDAKEESITVPVLVEFWAPWCGPCKMVARQAGGMPAQAIRQFIEQGAQAL